MTLSQSDHPPESSEVRRIEPKLKVLAVQRSRTHKSAPEYVQAAFADAGAAARFIANEPWPDQWHLEDAEGNRVSSVWYRGNYTHASALLPGAKTWWGAEDDPTAREKAAQEGWSILDMAGSEAQAPLPASVSAEDQPTTGSVG